MGSLLEPPRLSWSDARLSLKLMPRLTLDCTEEDTVTELCPPLCVRVSPSPPVTRPPPRPSTPALWWDRTVRSSPLEWLLDPLLLPLDLSPLEATESPWLRL